GGREGQREGELEGWGGERPRQRLPDAPRRGSLELDDEIGNGRPGVTTQEDSETERQRDRDSCELVDPEPRGVGRRGVRRSVHRNARNELRCSEERHGRKGKDDPATSRARAYELADEQGEEDHGER